MVYTNAPAGFEERAIELLADLVGGSCFPKDEIDREREVVTEEINSYLDSPSDSVYDEFEELAYAGSGLAHNILGSRDSVASLTGDDCRGFLDMYYTPANMVVYCCSPLDPQRLYRQVEKHFGSLHFPAPTHTRVAPRRWPLSTSFTTVAHTRQTQSSGPGCSGAKTPGDSLCFC